MDFYYETYDGKILLKIRKYKLPIIYFNFWFHIIYSHNNYSFQKNILTCFSSVSSMLNSSASVIIFSILIGIILSSEIFICSLKKSLSTVRIYLSVSASISVVNIKFSIDNNLFNSSIVLIMQYSCNIGFLQYYHLVCS